MMSPATSKGYIADTADLQQVHRLQTLCLAASVSELPADTEAAHLAELCLPDPAYFMHYVLRCVSLQ